MSTSDPEGAAGKVAYADVQDVIEAAARFKNEATEHLSVEELQEIAGELDIPAELVTPAIEEVRRRRELALGVPADVVVHAHVAVVDRCRLAVGCQVEELLCDLHRAVGDRRRDVRFEHVVGDSA